jgi:hypothetical protein
MNIPISNLIIENRRYFFDFKMMDYEDNVLFFSFKKFFFNRKIMNKRGWLKRFLLRKVLPKSVKKQIQLPRFSKKTFYQIKQKENKDGL